MFALTVEAEVAYVIYSDGRRAMRAEPPAEVMQLARRQRALAATLPAGPWWRLLLSLTSTGALDVDYDYADEPFEDETLLPAAAYRADIAAYPRDRLPTWLGAYLYHEGRQERSPRAAAQQARDDRNVGQRAALADEQFPDLPVLWARWAVLAAAFVAAQSPAGPRVLPSTGGFESSRRSGSTLYLLPGGRGVLSGGVWDSPELNAAYNDDAALPNLYAGAPEWVADPVLNPRTRVGLLSFCYWYVGGHWHRGDCADADRLSGAVPGVWTVGTVAGIIARLIADNPDDDLLTRAAELVQGAELGVVTRHTVANVFDGPGWFDIDGAMFQLTAAGLTLPEPLSRDEAVEQVRAWIRAQGIDSYPVDELVAERIPVGWLVYAPPPDDRIVVARAVFYIADDGVVERPATSIPPSEFEASFAERFRLRAGRDDLRGVL
jgi:hypothetical protein